MRKPFEKTLSLVPSGENAYSVRRNGIHYGRVRYLPENGYTEIHLSKKGGGSFGWTTKNTVTSIVDLLTSSTSMNKDTILRKMRGAVGQRVLSEKTLARRKQQSEKEAKTIEEKGNYVLAKILLSIAEVK